MKRDRCHRDVCDYQKERIDYKEANQQWLLSQTEFSIIAADAVYKIKFQACVLTARFAILELSCIRRHLIQHLHCYSGTQLQLTKSHTCLP